MTKYDIKNYLEKIYNIPVAVVRTRIQFGECLCAQAWGEGHDIGLFSLSKIIKMRVYQVK